MSWLGRGARYLGEHAISDVMAPVSDVAGRGADLADRLYRANRHAEQARAMLAKRQGAVQIGGEWFHGGSDRANALAQIGIDASALERDLDAAATSDADRAWVAMAAGPVFSAWRDFVARMAATQLAAYATEWSVFLAWQERFLNLRQLARARGLTLTSPEPQRLPKTIWERAASGEGSKLDGYLSIAKTAILGAVAVTGVIGFYSVLRDLRRPHAGVEE